MGTHISKEGIPYVPYSRIVLHGCGHMSIKLPCKLLRKFWRSNHYFVYMILGYNTIQADSSSKGLGACLLQNKQPVAYASRFLTETRYAQIEKELLSIVFATDKFHHYIYGQEVDVQSDHKPLENITCKPLHKASPRL